MSSDRDAGFSIKNILPSWVAEPSTCTIKPWMKFGAAVLVVFAIVLFAMYFRTLGDIDAGLYGFWEVDGNFAEKAHLDAMYIYIGAPNNNAKQSIGMFGCEIPIYVFLKADCAVRFNKVVKSHISRKTIRTDSLQTYFVDFGESVSIIPRSVSIEYDHVTQMLVLRDSKRIYARMFKKPEVSFYCTSSSMKTLERDNSSHDMDDEEQDDTNKADVSAIGGADRTPRKSSQKKDEDVSDTEDEANDTADE